MAVAKDIQGTVFRNATATFMARVENSAGETIDQMSVASIRYTIYELGTTDPQTLTPISGHNNVSLVVADAIYNTLQVDEAWSIDAVGYNFRHELNVATNEAFATAGAVYQVRFEITPTFGQKIVIRYQLRCI